MQDLSWWNLHRWVAQRVSAGHFSYIERGSFNVSLNYVSRAVQACAEVLHKTNDALCGLD